MEMEMKRCSRRALGRVAAILNSEGKGQHLLSSLRR